VKGGQVLPKKTTYAVRKSAEAPKGRRDGMSLAGAAELIAKAKLKQAALPLPSEAALTELRLLLEHNDSASWRERISAQEVIRMLRGMGWAGRERGALDTVCRMAFGRTSYGTP
jgi:hypothetical protein